MPNDKPTTVPARQCVFQAELEVNDRKSDSDRSTPFTGIARTGDALNHAYWGRVVHDLDGMRVKPRIPIDWNHTDTLVGYANKFNTETGDLEIAGALTPTKFDQTQRAQQIIDQSEQGVPFEMSISFPGDLELERVPKGKQVEVNQRAFDGPLTVIRSWSLRAVAVTPMGQDPQTALQFADDQTVNVTYREAEMPDETTKIEDVSELSVSAPEEALETEIEDSVDDAITTTEEVAAGVEINAETETVDTEEKDTPLELSERDPKEFQTVFGKVQGSVYFADGLSIEQAMAELRVLRHRRRPAAPAAVKKPPLRREASDGGASSTARFTRSPWRIANIATAPPMLCATTP